MQDTSTAEERLALVREYVDHPGNWGTYDNRRHLLLAMIDGKIDYWREEDIPDGKTR